MPNKKSGANKSVSSRSLVSKNRFSKNALALFVLIFAAIGAYMLLKSFAAPTPPNMYLNNAPSFVAPGQTFTVQLRENSGGTAVNALEADISYPTTLLTWVSTTPAGIANTNLAYVQQNTGGGGLVTYDAALQCNDANTPPCPPAPTTDQLIATITFKANAAVNGGATLAFTTGTAVYSVSPSQNIVPLSSTGPATVNVDGTAPVETITAPANNASLGGGSTVSITTTSSDASSGIQKVEFYIDGTLKQTVASPGPYNYSWATTGVALGAHTIQTKAYDNVGNITSSSVVNVTLADQTAPSAPGSFRVTGTTINTIGLAWNASTDNVGVTSYKITRNGTLVATVTSPTLVYTDTGLSAATTYSYGITALDAAGNASSASTVSGATSTVTPGDINTDGKVNGADLAFLASVWKTANAQADLNSDGIVNIADLSILLSHYTGG